MKRMIILMTALEHALDVATYPFRGMGWAMLAGGTLVLWALGLLGRLLPVMGIMLTFFICGYLAAYMLKIIVASVAGELTPPDWPDFLDLLEDILRPMLLVGLSLLACLAPAAIAAIWAMGGLEPAAILSPAAAVAHLPITKAALACALLGLGVLYLPMALLAVAIFESPKALDPRLIVPAMRRSGLAYLLTAAAFLGGLWLYLLLTWLLGRLPLIGPLLSSAVGLYFLMALMRLLGLFYCLRQDRLGWQVK